MNGQAGGLAGGHILGVTTSMVLKEVGILKETQGVVLKENATLTEAVDVVLGLNDFGLHLP